MRSKNKSHGLTVSYKWGSKSVCVGGGGGRVLNIRTRSRDMLTTLPAYRAPQNSHHLRLRHISGHVHGFLGMVHYAPC